MMLDQFPQDIEFGGVLLLCRSELFQFANLHMDDMMLFNRFVDSPYHVSLARTPRTAPKATTSPNAGLMAGVPDVINGLPYRRCILRNGLSRA